jgi:hypothetical protein
MKWNVCVDKLGQVAESENDDSDEISSDVKEAVR